MFRQTASHCRLHCCCWPQEPKRDYGAVRAAIEDILDAPEGYDDGSYGPVLVRLAWHASGTYDKATNTGGSNGATMRCVLVPVGYKELVSCSQSLAACTPAVHMTGNQHRWQLLQWTHHEVGAICAATLEPLNLALKLSPACWSDKAEVPLCWCYNCPIHNYLLGYSSVASVRHHSCLLTAAVRNRAHTMSPHSGPDNKFLPWLRPPPYWLT